MFSKSQSSTFLDMPMRIAHLVLEKMDPMDQLSARKACQKLKTAVDEVGIRFNKITIKLEKDLIRVELDVDKPYGKCIQYRDETIGTIVIFSSGRRTRIEKENFVQTVCRDLKILLKHAESVEIHSNQARREWRSYRNDYIDRHFTTELAKLEECFHIKEICLISFWEEYVLRMLSLFDATTLQSIAFCENPDLSFDKIIQLDQWKNIKEFKLRRRDGWFDSNMLAYLVDLQSFTIEQTWLSFPIQCVVQIRDDVMRRSTFQSCTVQFGLHYTERIDFIEIAKVFKPEYAGGNEFEIVYSNDDDKFMIKCQKFLSNDWWDGFCFCVKRLSSDDFLHIKNYFDSIFIEPAL
eukprot:NP_497527.2 F-box A protein [Caenorhabditis elegans]